MSANCEECVYYDYDEELAAYVCEADLDEDEMERFLRGGTRDCPFYRPGAHCAPRLHRALGTEDQGAVRFSWSYFNTEAETDAAAEAVRILAAEAV